MRKLRKKVVLCRPGLVWQPGPGRTARPIPRLAALYQSWEREYKKLSQLRVFNGNLRKQHETASYHAKGERKCRKREEMVIIAQFPTTDPPSHSPHRPQMERGCVQLSTYNITLLRKKATLQRFFSFLFFFFSLLFPPLNTIILHNIIYYCYSPPRQLPGLKYPDTGRVTGRLDPKTAYSAAWTANQSFRGVSAYRTASACRPPRSWARLSWRIPGLFRPYPRRICRHPGE